MKNVKILEKIKRKGFPTNSGEYKTAHSEADQAEKNKYPKGYKVMKKIDKKIPKSQLAGKNTKSGKIEVSKLVPKKYRKEVAFHEKEENKSFKRLKK